MDNNWLEIETNEDGQVVLERCSSNAEGNIGIPSNVTKIGWNAFVGCNNIESITIPESVVSIGSYAFGTDDYNGRCSAKSIEINGSNIEINGDVFSSLWHLETIQLCNYSILNSLKGQSIGPEVKIKVGVDGSTWHYGILSVLYDKCPEAFIASSNDKSLFDKGLYVHNKNTNDWIMIYFLPNNQVCICSDFSTRKIPTSVSFETCKPWRGRDDAFIIEGRLIYEDGTSHEFEYENCHFKLNKESYTVNCFGYIGYKDGQDPHFSYLIVPKSIDLFFVDQQRKWERVIFDELSFSGNLPEVLFMGDVEIAVVRINSPKNEVVIPEVIKNALEDVNRRRYGKIIYAAPSLCREESIVPGYIKATAWSMDDYHRNDEIVEINSRFIVSVEPEQIECYNPATGSVIHCASNGIEMHQSIHVYEPVDMIMDKINKSVSRIDANTLLQEIETICKKHS